MSVETMPETSEPKPEDIDVYFVADARLISVLGEQLIGSEKVGVLELVKNTYDAGARKCTVTLEGVPGLEPHRTLPEYAGLPGPIIEIVDDGSGMTKDAIVNGWLRPATPRRAQVKEQLRRERAAADLRGTRSEYDALVEKLRAAHGGRLPLGEKGIGRLATHRLGRMLWLRTKTADDPFEWELKIDWSSFDAGDGAPLDLHKVKMNLRHQPPTATYPRGCGTVICCYGGRAGYSWTKDDIVDVGRAVNALRSPTKAPDGFEPSFASTHVDPKALGSPLDRVPAPFELVMVVDELGRAEWEFKYDPPTVLSDAPPAIDKKDGKDLRSTKPEYWLDEKAPPPKPGEAPPPPRAPECGPFLLHIHAYLRLPEWLGLERKDVTDYLDKFGGITMYRDGLAARPAQESARTDWLGLNQAQIKRSANISYYHLAGSLELSQEKTLGVRDRSSREGMIETRAYRDLTELTKAAVNLLQNEMQSVRNSWSKTKGERLPPKTLRAHAKIAADIGRAVIAAYDFKKDPLDLVDKVGGKKAPENIEAATVTLDQLGEQLDLLDDEREGLLEAAGFGLAVSVAVHEIGKLAGAIVSDTKRLRTSLTKGTPAAEIADTLRTRADSLLGETKRLAPLRVLRGESPRLFSIKSAIEAARSAFVYSLQESQIVLHVNREDFQVRARFGLLAQVFANLIDNSIYWIKNGGVIQFAVSSTERTVLVSDSGRGLSKTIEAHLFEAFYSEKVPPSGLGLYISKHYLAQCKAKIRSAKPSERSKLTGAQFILDFSKSPAE